VTPLISRLIQTILLHIFLEKFLRHASWKDPYLGCDGGVVRPFFYA
jgi:hypothetical protein